MMSTDESPAPLIDSIRADNVSVAYGSHQALGNASFTINAGQSLAIIGPNGSGKTTLLKLIAGLLGPTTGTITIPPQTVVGYVSQHASRPQWLPLTARDVLRMGRYRRRGLIGRITDGDRRTMDWAAAQLRIDDILDRRYGDLSGGQQRNI